MMRNMVRTATWTTTYRVPDSLPSDTEDSVVGTEWHQEAIGALADMLRAVADRRGVAWGVCEQVALVGLTHKNKTDYDPRPDVMVLRQPLSSGGLASVRIADVGAPLFVAEAASDSTKANDQGDKRQAYAAVGVPEYIVFDPSGDVLSTPLLAWRLAAGTYVPWRPDRSGWWHSASLDVSFRATQPFLSMRDRDGTPVELSREVRRRNWQLEQDLGETARRLADTERARAEEARARAEEARQRASLEQRLADAEEQLRRLRGESDE